MSPFCLGQELSIENQLFQIRLLSHSSRWPLSLKILVHELGREEVGGSFCFWASPILELPPAMSLCPCGPKLLSHHVPKTSAGPDWAKNSSSSRKFCVTASGPICLNTLPLGPSMLLMAGEETTPFSAASPPAAIQPMFISFGSGGRDWGAV